MVYLKDGQFFNDERIVLLDDINKILITLDLVAPNPPSPKIVSSRGRPSSVLLLYLRILR